MSSRSLHPLYGWLIIAGLIVFGAYLLWDAGLFASLYQNDQTHLSLVIVSVFIFTTLYLGWCSVRLSRQNVNDGQFIESSSWAGQYLEQLAVAEDQSTNYELLQTRLIANVHGLHYHGWFIADVLVRLGLIGTVIGFVLMLGSVNQLQADEIHALKQLLSSMGTGMQVALFTTLTGLGSAILLSVQCHWLDHCADNLVSRIIDLGLQHRQRES